jgi:hypothetical protein
LAAFYTLAELRLRLLRQREREGIKEKTIRTRMRAVNVSGSKAYLTVVATAKRWVFCFGDARYCPNERSGIFRPDKEGYLTIDLSYFDPDGQPSFYAYVPSAGALEEVRVEVMAPWEFHIFMPEGAMTTSE